jgi:hypothetical protein
MQYSFSKVFSMHRSVAVSSKVARGKKKESGDRSVNGYLLLWLACLLLSACCCCRLHLCRSLGELRTHSPGPAGFVYSEFSCKRATATSFPLSKHTGGGDTAPAFSGLRVYLQLTWEVGLPLSPVEFSSFCHSHKLSHSWLLGAWPRSHQSLSGQARLVYLQFQEGFPSSPLRCSGHPSPPSLLHVLILLIAYYSVSLFSPGGGRSVQGAMLIWPRVVCGSTAYDLAHLVHVFPSRLVAGDWWWPGGPPGFSVQCEVEILWAGWRCGGVKVLPLFGSFACKVCLQHLYKISLEAHFLLPPSSRYLGISSNLFIYFAILQYVLKE